MGRPWEKRRERGSRVCVGGKGTVRKEEGTGEGGREKRGKGVKEVEVQDVAVLIVEIETSIHLKMHAMQKQFKQTSCPMISQPTYG
eukprot:364402-Chlamydomonas_euryale.AAC.8